MNRCCLIIPYFGRFPQIFPLFLKSMEYNVDYDWLLFTDNDIKYPIPENLRIVKTSFESIKDLIQSKFAFKIVLDSPYKLCDYKCAYGYIFSDFLLGYEFWGYCDIDLILGKISNFILPDHFREYDKIGHLGHFSLYRNSEKMQMLFTCGDFYKKVFTSSKIFVFDEWNEGSINHIAQKKAIRLCMLNSWSDVYPFYSYLSEVQYCLSERGEMIYRPDNKCHLYIWKNGSIFSYINKKQEIVSEEKMYVHFQKRNFNIDHACLSKNESFICGPKSIRSNNNRIFASQRYISIVLKFFNYKRICKMITEYGYLCRSRLSVIVKGDKNNVV